MAVFAALANNEIYSAQFRVELDADKVYVSCRSCNLVEDVIPGENELFYLFAMPQSYMEDYGDGILAVLDGGDPYEAVSYTHLDTPWFLTENSRKIALLFVFLSSLSFSVLPLFSSKLSLIHI